MWKIEYWDKKINFLQQVYWKNTTRGGRLSLSNESNL